MNGPLMAGGPSDPSVELMFSPPFFEWWNSSTDGRVYHGLEESLEAVATELAENGPYDGLIGFSQGGSLVAALIGLQEHGEVLQNQPSFRAAIIVGSFKPRADRLALGFHTPLLTPSLHVYGEEDRVVPPSGSMRLAAAFEAPRIVGHGGGHHFPKLAVGNPAVRTELRVFLESVRAQVEEEAEEVSGSGSAAAHGREGAAEGAAPEAVAAERAARARQGRYVEEGMVENVSSKGSSTGPGEVRRVVSISAAGPGGHRGASAHRDVANQLPEAAAAVPRL